MVSAVISSAAIMINFCNNIILKLEELAGIGIDLPSDSSVPPFFSLNILQ